MKKYQLETIDAYNNCAKDYEDKILKLNNYNHTYDFLSEKIKDNSDVLDLACGPGNISKYLLQKKNLNIKGYDLSTEMIKLAEKNIPTGKFFQKSIINFKTKGKVDLIINGFGIPYLEFSQVIKSLECSYENLKSDGLFYISFMNGSKSGFEKPSFNKDEQFYIYYHEENEIIHELQKIGFSILKKWEIDYKEADDSITTDVVIVSKR